MPVLIAVSVIIGIVLGNSLTKIQAPSSQNFLPQRANKLSTIVELINEAYVDSVSTNELVEKTIPELLKIEADPAVSKSIHTVCWIVLKHPQTLAAIGKNIASNS